VNAQVVQLQTAAHREIEELLPWYASGALGQDERERVEQHVPFCPQCRADLAFEQRLLTRVQALPSPDADVEQGIARLRRRIAVVAPQGRVDAAGAGAPAAAAQPGWQDAPRWLRWALVVQGGVIAALGVALLVPVQDFRGLAASSPDDRAAAQLIVRFHPGASEQDVRAALIASAARIVNGPTATGAYVLAVPESRMDSAIAELRARAAVALAESLEARHPQ
jgi:hypothetical protein